ncbi:MAG: 23S rRNA (guanosine(2251)-2'-O)-methyltransferase RlmB [Rhodospirillaceae bacterium]|nr:23S rRNA (guanosine(2251)-2'-O)-methyltransferase RlmB [Rhodospirillaceae bacterium]
MGTDAGQRKPRPAGKRPPGGPVGSPRAGRNTAPPSARPPERWLYGLHAVRAAWLNPARLCRRLLLTQTAADQMAAPFAEAQAAGLDRPAPEVVDRGVIDKRLPPGAVHQGLALEAEPLPETDLDDLGRAAAVHDRAVVLVLDRVTDPHNIGAVLRSAAAFGALGVVVPDRHAPPVTGVLIKSASGALEHVPLVRVTNLAQALDRLAEFGLLRLGLDERGDTPLPAVAAPPKVAVVLGAEGAGLRRLTAEHCDRLVRLPTSGPIASLNVSNAAAIALYELARCRDNLRPRVPA